MCSPDPAAAPVPIPPAATVAAPAATAATGGGRTPVGAFWGDTVLRVPAGLRRDVLTGAEVRAGDGGLPLRELFSALPIGVVRTIR